MSTLNGPLIRPILTATQMIHMKSHRVLVLGVGLSKPACWRKVVKDCPKH